MAIAVCHDIINKTSSSEVLDFVFKTITRLSELKVDLVPQIADFKTIQVVCEKLDIRTQQDISEALRCVTAFVVTEDSQVM